MFLRLPSTSWVVEDLPVAKNRIIADGSSNNTPDLKVLRMYVIAPTTSILFRIFLEGLDNVLASPTLSVRIARIRMDGNF